MNYSKEEFFDLMERAEEQNCTHLDEVCADPRFAGDLVQVMRGCYNSSLFNVPYESIVAEAGPQILEKVCAVDDDMGRWPRFGGDRFGKD